MDAGRSDDRERTEREEFQMNGTSVEQKQRYCEDCKHFQLGSMGSTTTLAARSKFAYCLRFPQVPETRYDLVTKLTPAPVKYQTCALQRSRTDLGSCTAEGLLWEAKEDEEEERKESGKS